MSDADFKTKSDFRSSDISTAQTRAGRPQANPSALGLSAFGVTTFVLSCYNAKWGVPGNAPPMIVLGLALFYGGVVQLLAGMWEFYVGNTFGGTAFSSFGGFWLSYACVLIPAFQETASYLQPSPGFNDPTALNHALGIFLLGWTILGFILFLCTLRQNVVSILLFGMLDITFVLLTISYFQSDPINSAKTKQAAGYTGIVTALVSLYIVLAMLANKEHTYFTLPVGMIVNIEKHFSDMV